jgi:hypothetical protein
MIEQIATFVKFDGMSRGPEKFFLGSDTIEHGGDFGGIDGFGIVPHETEDDGGVSAVSFARSGERAVKMTLQSVGVMSDFGIGEVVHKERRSSHGTHGVGTGRTDSNSEEIENRNHKK